MDDLLNRIHTAQPTPLTLNDDEFAMLDAYVETLPRLRMSLRCLQIEKQDGSDGYQNALDAERDFRAHLKCVLRYNSHQRETLARTVKAKAAAPGADGEPVDNDSGGASRTHSKRRRQRRGRHLGSNLTEDARIAEAWDTGCYNTYVELADRLKLEVREVKRAIDRHRKRRKNTPQ